MTYQPPHNPYQNGPSQPNPGGQPYPQQPGPQPGFGQPGSQPGFGQPGSQPGFTQQDPYAQPTYGQQQPGYQPQQQPYGNYPHGGPPPQQGSGAKAGIIVAAIAALAIGGVAAGYFFLGDDDDKTASDTETAETSDTKDDSTDDPTDEETEVTDDPTGVDEQALIEEFNLVDEGQCLSEQDEPVACDDVEAEYQLLRWVFEPEDPDPSDAEHALAADDACSDLPEFEFYYYLDSVTTGDSTVWDPDQDELFVIGCASIM